MARAVARQVKEHLGPAWGIVAPKVKAVRNPAPGYDLSATPNGVRPIMLLDSYDDPSDRGALGWHSEQADVPFGKIFAGPVLDDGQGAVLRGATLDVPTLASVFSHEVIEMTLDPFVNAWCEGTVRGSPALVALEGSDAVEGDQYDIDGVAVSNFVLPEYFNPDQSRPGKYDWLGKLAAPFTMSPGGYMVVRRNGGPASNIYAPKHAGWRKVMRAQHAGARAHKRLAAV